MRFHTVAASLLLAILTAQATAAPLTIQVGNWLLQPNTPNQQIQIYASGGDGMEAMDIYVQIGSGNEFSPPGEPKIANVDLVTGTIYDGHTSTPAPGIVQFNYDQFWVVSIANDVSELLFPNPSLIATITIDTVGVNGSTMFPIILSSANWTGIGSGYWDENTLHEFIVTDGSITSVPEPSGLPILGMALVGLMVTALRRGRR